MKRVFVILLTIIGLASCSEKMIIDTQDGVQLVGISGSITDEYKKHEIIISRTADFYAEEQPEMISNATVYVVDGADTIWYEETDNPGYYLTKNPLSGEPGHTYNLSIYFSDEDGNEHFYAQSTMRNNVEKIDSIVVKTLVFNALEFKNMLGVYPYFLTTDDPQMCYMTRVSINGKDVGGDTLTKCMLFESLGYAGIYFNGPFMVAIAGEFPVYGLNQRDSLQVVHHGDTVTLDLWSIPQDYSIYISEISSSNGTNPMLGIPSNVSTNIYPEGKAVGCFHASSLRQCSVIY